jgi:hypothetical protein
MVENGKTKGKLARCGAADDIEGRKKCEVVAGSARDTVCKERDNN